MISGPTIRGGDVVPEKRLSQKYWRVWALMLEKSPANSLQKKSIIQEIKKPQSYLKQYSLEFSEILVICREEMKTIWSD